MKALDMLQPKKVKKHKHTRLPICSPIGPNTRWEGDLTYVWDGTKINYLFAIVDGYDREPIGDCYSLRCSSEESIVSLEEAVKKRFGSLEPVDCWRVTIRKIIAQWPNRFWMPVCLCLLISPCVFHLTIWTILEAKFRRANC